MKKNRLYTAKEVSNFKKNMRQDAIRFLKIILRRHKDTLFVVLKSHLFVEQLMNDILLLSFPNPPSRKVLEKDVSFSSKIKLLENVNLDFIEGKNILGRIRCLNEIRNGYGHNLNYRLKKRDLNGLLENFKISRNRPLYDLLEKGVSGLVGYLLAARALLKTLPFLVDSMRNQKRYKDDKVFQIKNIIKEYKDSGLSEVLSGLRLEEADKILPQELGKY